MCHVLIIEDEPIIALMIEDVLAEEGATSFAFAATQHEAVAAAIEQPPALIISDVKLLEGTGPLAVAEIQARIGRVPVMFLTATPAECHPCEVAAVIIAKPFDRFVLKSAFHDLMG